MEKIEKLELTEDEKYHLEHLLNGGLEITDSISQVEIYKGILGKLNQKQPEVVTNGYVETVIGKWSKKRNQPEKQEEWRKEIRRIVYIRPSSVRDADSLTREVLEIVDQLLSERTFSKEELEMIDDWAEWDYCTNEDVVKVKKKVFKLLKEEE